MSCKRNHRERFIGCHVGPVRVRGCSRGCCPYNDADIEKNERWNYLDRHRPAHGRCSRLPEGIPNYAVAPNGNHNCQSPYRPKFVCLPCRRAFKAAVIESNQYEIWEDDRPGWWFAPKNYLTRALLTEWESLERDPTRRDEYARIIEDTNAYRNATRTFTREEVEELRRHSPDAWWQPLHQLRCPQCSKDGVAVGNTFRAPPKKDEKAWKRVAELIEAGEKFTYCLSQKEEEKLILRAES